MGTASAGCGSHAKPLIFSEGALISGSAAIPEDQELT
jgi:hypothetical protein